MNSPVNSLLQRADQMRKAGRWGDALGCYEQVYPLAKGNAAVAHNIALCCLAMSDPIRAVQFSREALHHSPGLWQSRLILVKALQKLGDKHTALAEMRKLIVDHPDLAENRMQMASLALHVLGAACEARNWAEACLNHASVGVDARLMDLITRLYDRDESVDQLHARLMHLASTDLFVPDLSSPRVPLAPTGSGRYRVGLLSPQFFASPVYFFTYGVLKELVGQVDLVFVNRGFKQDWATQAFRKLASQWIDVPSDTAEELRHKMRSLQLDALIDLGGWMDPVALRALSVKVARRQFKWVGGQSVSTGLTSFDGFITDRHQTPKGYDRFFTEPLLRLKAGYVTYTPPSYMPSPQPRVGDVTRLGVIANPAKISRAFLDDLAQRHAKWQRRQGEAPVLVFVESRHQEPECRQRIERTLRGLPLEFVVPDSHKQYLEAIAGLDAVIDTFPYSGGLTSMEALMLGVPVFTKAGELFCERHTLAHCRFIGLTSESYNLDKYDGRRRPHEGRVLVPADCARLQHAALAQELLSCLI